MDNMWLTICFLKIYKQRVVCVHPLYFIRLLFKKKTNINDTGRLSPPTHPQPRITRKCNPAVGWKVETCNFSLWNEKLKKTDEFSAIWHVALVRWSLNVICCSSAINSIYHVINYAGGVIINNLILLRQHVPPPSCIKYILSIKNT